MDSYAKYVKHIDARHMWNYVNFRAELDSQEKAHLSSCQHCLQLFKRCVLAETPDMIEDSNPSQQRSA